MFCINIAYICNKRTSISYEHIIIIIRIILIIKIIFVHRQESELLQNTDGLQVRLLGASMTTDRDTFC